MTRSAERNKNVRRTALILFGLALTFYVVFILTGVLRA